jgi:signal recognition particle GTPase
MFDSLGDRLQGIAKRLRGKGRLTEADVDEVLAEIRTALLEADVNVDRISYAEKLSRYAAKCVEAVTKYKDDINRRRQRILADPNLGDSRVDLNA